MTFPYRKLTRKKRTIAGSTQLWLGDDHVLMVRSHRFVEEYRRFQLSDIQAVLASSDATRWPLRIAMILVAVVFIALAITATSAAGRGFLAFIAIGGAGIAAYDVVRGQRCRSWILTEVSTEPLEPVTRASDYTRFMRELGPALEAAQGGRIEAEFPLEPSGPAFVKVAETNGSRYMQHAMFVMFLANAFVYATAYLWKFEQGFPLAITILFSELVVAMLLAMRSGYFGVEKGLMKTFVTACAVIVFLDTISGIWQGLDLLYQVAELGRQGGKPPVFWDRSLPMLLGKISITWRVIAGLTGLTALWIAAGNKAREVNASPDQPQQTQ